MALTIDISVRSVPTYYVGDFIYNEVDNVIYRYDSESGDYLIHDVVDGELILIKNGDDAYAVNTFVKTQVLDDLYKTISFTQSTIVDVVFAGGMVVTIRNTVNDGGTVAEAVVKCEDDEEFVVEIARSVASSACYAAGDIWVGCDGCLARLSVKNRPFVVSKLYSGNSILDNDNIRFVCTIGDSVAVFTGENNGSGIGVYRIYRDKADNITSRVLGAFFPMYRSGYVTSVYSNGDIMAISMSNSNYVVTYSCSDEVIRRYLMDGGIVSLLLHGDQMFATTGSGILRYVPEITRGVIINGFIAIRSFSYKGIPYFTDGAETISIIDGNLSDGNFVDISNIVGVYDGNREYGILVTEDSVFSMVVVPKCMPAVINHNDTMDKQGGDSVLDEYYHLSKAQYDAILTLIAPT